MSRAAQKQPEGSGNQLSRLRVVIHGAVQGVGFRPFVYRLATSSGLAGWVKNSSEGVFIEAEGSQERLCAFLARLEQDKPPHSFIQSLESSFLDPAGFKTFEIRESDGAGEKTALVLPDIAVCAECLSDIFQPDNRRYLYPFTNCTNCGPRFSIIEALPYDRSNSTMKDFTMCDECRAEYENPLDRRFHAQPNACPACGPHVELWNAEGRAFSTGRSALQGAAEAICRRDIVAVKGLGGFHLVVDARSEEAVRNLRERKHREEKPLALMFPTLESIQERCEVSNLEQRLLLSPQAPIVLLRRKRSEREPGPTQQQAISPLVAPGNPYLGVMLPYTPLHHLLMAELGFPVVATSGNLSDEPICTDEHEAVDRLGHIADVFLAHNRPIARRVDDSIVRVMKGREIILRRARGYAPLPVRLSQPGAPILAVGAHLKNTVAASLGDQVFLSQHIGDLETSQAFEAFQNVIRSFRGLYEHTPAAVACDAHPGYLSTQFAREGELPFISVQHHYAHVLSCMAENDLEGPVLGVSWDGTGYGSDGTLWGGEFLRITADTFDRECACLREVGATPFQRVAHFRTFRLPGGEKAIKEPRRAAVGLLQQLFGDDVFSMQDLAPLQAFSPREIAVLRSMLRRGLNAPVTSSAGRLFDAVAAIIGLRQQARFEGQAAMELEFALDGTSTEEHYDFQLTRVGAETVLPAVVVDWALMVAGILDDVRSQAPASMISAKFHNTLVEMIVAVAHRIGEEKVVLTGGCFQNRYLTERAVDRLQNEKFRAYWHQRVPPNDGGIALGQTVAAARALREE